MISTQPVHARPGPRGEQVVEVLADHGFRPQSIVARAGIPLRLIVRRRDEDACMDRIVFSSPHLDRRMAPGAATTIVLPGQPAGEIRFTCGMGRYHGQIELRSEASVRDAMRVALAEGIRRGARLVRQAVQPNGDTAMSHVTEPSRGERRAAAIADRRSERRRGRTVAFQGSQGRRARIRTLAFGIVAAGVLGAGVLLAAGDLFGQRGSATTADAIPVRMSMAGFTPGEIRVPAGQTVALELWTTDAAAHLHNSVHTMISDELGIYEELPAAGPTGESRRVVEFSTPATPGAYDIYCDTCCGGKQSPTMHGRLIVEA